MVRPYGNGMRAIVRPRRVAQVAAVVLGVLVLAQCAGTVVLDSVLHTLGTGGPVIEALSIGAAAIPAATVSTLLAVRRPGNPIGWLLFVILIIGASPSNEYDIWVFRMHHGSELLGRVSLAVQEAWPLLLVAVAVLLWVFPDGKLPGGRWRRPSVVLLIVGVALAVLCTLPGIAAAARPVVRVAPDGSAAGSSAGVFVVLYVAVIALCVIAWLAWLVIQIPTYRHADGERRQQLKWLYSGGGVTLVAFIFGIFVVPLATGQSPGSGTHPLRLAFLVVAFGALPVCLGVAVLKYRLYELDRIISRVVSYTLVTGLLVGLYAGLVLLATQVLSASSPVAVAASTLAAAALFTPVRRRVQRAVDRRFNRTRYDADQTVTAFADRLKDAVNPDAVCADLAGVVSRSLEPAHVTVWMNQRG
jgi:hypothetical protein